MKKIQLLIVFAMATLAASAQSLFIDKGQTFHRYQVADIQSITFDKPDSMFVTTANGVHAYGRANVSNMSPKQPDITCGAQPQGMMYANETFATDFGQFTNVTVEGKPWIIDFQTAKATGYANSTTTKSRSYLVSPAYDLTIAKKATLSFKYILGYAGNGPGNHVLITDNYTGDPSTTQWTDITGTLISSGTSGINWYSFNDYSCEIPSRFIGESHVTIALYFGCDTKSTTWEVKNLQLLLNEKIDGGDIIDDNVDKNNLNRNPTANAPEAWRLEFPHIKGDDMNLVITHSTQQYGITYSLEWDCTLKSQRWTCYEFHAGTPDNNVGRVGSWQDDPDIPSQYRTHTGDFSGTGFSRGHMCMSNDRQSSAEQNKQTFYISNAHPQYQNHNGGLWQTLENKVNYWGNTRSFCDTLYVVKAGTIDKSNQVLMTTSTGLLVPKYFYMAVLSYKDGQYKAIGFWTEHTNTSITKANPADYAISIKELEELTGIDFFCNLPDDIEAEVEESYTLSDWGLSK